MNTVVNVKVGQMPGRIQEFAVEVGTTVADVLTLAELDATGFDVRVDGDVQEITYAVTSATKNILLVKKIKGNK